MNHGQEDVSVHLLSPNLRNQRLVYLVIVFSTDLNEGGPLWYRMIKTTSVLEFYSSIVRQCFRIRKEKLRGDTEEFKFNALKIKIIIIFHS